MEPKILIDSIFVLVNIFNCKEKVSLTLVNVFYISAIFYFINWKKIQNVTFSGYDSAIFKFIKSGIDGPDSLFCSNK